MWTSFMQAELRVVYVVTLSAKSQVLLYYQSITVGYYEMVIQHAI